MDGFRYVLSDCHLGDLGYRGSNFIWNNRRDSDNFIKERLDRALATTEWCCFFLELVVKVLAARSSNHKPLWICFQQAQSRVPKLFRDEPCCDVDEECATVIKSAWAGRVVGASLVAETRLKLERCQQALAKWSSTKHGAVSMSLKSLTKRLEGLQRYEQPDNQNKIKQLEEEIHQLFEMEDLR
jgi:hypothetical protein